MNNNTPVAVLLAAYNGTKWIKEQIDSILNQRDVETNLFISVDLSSDGTYEYCKELALKNKNIKVLSYGDFFGGAAKNFFRLIKDVDLNSYDYVSLADQDDIWFSDKLSRAVNFIKDRNLDAYSSNVKAFWKNGREIITDKSYPQKKYDHFFEAAGPGCTYLMKRKSIQNFKYFLLKNWNSVNKVQLHDWMIYAYFRSNSMLWYIDKAPSVYYRQHETNQIGSNDNIKAYLNRIKKIKSKWYSKEVKKIVNLLKPFDNETVKLDRLFLIKNFYKLRRRPRDAFFLLFINIFGLFN